MPYLNKLEDLTLAAFLFITSIGFGLVVEMCKILFSNFRQESEGVNLAGLNRGVHLGSVVSTTVPLDLL